MVGADCDIRENVTMNTGTEDGGGVTEVGDHCFLMVGTHVGHDCKVGNNVVFANNVLLAATSPSATMWCSAAARRCVNLRASARAP